MSKDTKLIMESWRGYVYRENSLESLFERQDYITNVLGITLPINESGVVVLNEELKQQILEEHLILEGFLSDLVDKAKKTSGEMKKLLIALKNIFTDKTGSAINAWMKIVKRMMGEKTKFLLNMVEFFSQIDSLKPLADKIKAKLEKALQYIKTAENNWKTCMVGASLIVAYKYLEDKFNDTIAPLKEKWDEISQATQDPKSAVKDTTIGVAKDKLIEEIKQYIKEAMAKFFGQDFVANATKRLTDFMPWLKWISTLVKGAAFVADALARPAVMAARVSDAPLVIPNAQGQTQGQT